MFFLLINSLLLAQKDSEPEQLSKEEQLRNDELAQNQEFEQFIPTEEQHINTIDGYVEYCNSNGNSMVAQELITHCLYLILKHGEVVNSQKLADKLMNIPIFESLDKNNPESDYGVLTHSFEALYYFEKYTGVREYVLEHLDHDEFLLPNLF